MPRRRRHAVLRPQRFLGCYPRYATRSSVCYARRVVTWGDFRRLSPLLAEKGRAAFYEYGGVGLGFLATVRRDGGPRVHPVCPIITEDGLFAFIIPGPKLRDLRRDGRYALHSETLPPPRHDDGFYVAGTATEVSDRAMWERVATKFLTERNQGGPPAGFDEQALFEFSIDTCLLTLTSADGEFPAGPTVWRPTSAARVPG